MRDLRAAPFVVVALLLLCIVPVRPDSLADRVGRVNALCLTGNVDGEITGAQVNGVTCAGVLACLAYQSFSSDELALLQYGDFSVIDPSCPKGQAGVAGYLLDADMAQSARDAAGCLQSAAAPYGLGQKVEYYDLLFSFDTVPYIAAGPSAGLAFAIAAYSSLTGTPVLHEVGITGEITAEGAVLPVGGVLPKLRAAMAAGLGTVVLPEGDRVDLPQVPPEVLTRVRLVFVSRVEQALFHALGPYGPEGARYGWLAARYGEGVRLTQAGELTVAAAQFAALAEAMPEDYSVSVWRRYIASRLAAQASAPIAAPTG